MSYFTVVVMVSSYEHKVYLYGCSKFVIRGSSPEANAPMVQRFVVREVLVGRGSSVG